MVLGHEHCGAVGAALTSKPEGFVKYITDEICEAIGDEKDEYRACCLNVKRGVSILKESLKVGDGDELKVCGAYYRISDGAVEFFD